MLVCVDPGGGGEEARDLSCARPPFYAQRHGGSVSCSRTHHHREELPAWLWQ